MTGFVNVGGNPMSRVTIASLQDMGYQVNMAAAQPYELPNHLLMAEDGVLAEHAAMDRGIVLPRIPMTLPEDSLGH
jgi:hypothetical protein